MDYTSTYKSTKSNSGNMSLDKGMQREYNQNKNKANSGAGLSSVADSAAPETLFTSGTNIGTASVDYAPEKFNTKGTYIGSADVSSSYVPFADTNTNSNETSLGNMVEAEKIPFGGSSAKTPAKQISYADSGKMVDYLYSDENIENNLDFLERNDYPSPLDRELNKQLYGNYEETANLYNRFMEKTNNALNPTLPDEIDRLFLSGFLGDEAEQIEYDRKVSEAKKAKIDLLKQFENTEFAHLLGDTEINPISVTKAINKEPNAPVKMTDALNRNPNEDVEVEEYLDHNWLWRFRSDFEKPDGWVWALTTLVNTFSSGAHPAQIAARNPAFHKAVWWAGAEAFLKPKGYTESARLLKHSLQFNPQDLHEDGYSQLAKLIRTDKSFVDWVNGLIKNSDGKSFKDGKILPFEERDLYFSLHNCTVKVNGEKNEAEGYWTIKVSTYDEYDFTEIATGMGGGGTALGKLANDAAAVSQLMGAITPYKIYVDFVMQWRA